MADAPFFKISSGYNYKLQIYNDFKRGLTHVNECLKEKFLTHTSFRLFSLLHGILSENLAKINRSIL